MLRLRACTITPTAIVWACTGDRSVIETLLAHTTYMPTVAELAFFALFVTITTKTSVPAAGARAIKGIPRDVATGTRLANTLNTAKLPL
jgi:hypothetical protein